MKKQSVRCGSVIVGLFILSLCLAGCASSKGSVKPVAPLQEDISLMKYENILIEVQNNQNVQITSSDKERILMQIIAAIKKDHSRRFKRINEGNPDPATLKSIVNITRYDKGSAFARAMLVGLGQIKINADVTLIDSISNAPLCKNEVTKTFAWGGIYGATTSIETVEEGFAKAVADSIVSSGGGGT